MLQNIGRLSGGSLFSINDSSSSSWINEVPDLNVLAEVAECCAEKSEALLIADVAEETIADGDSASFKSIGTQVIIIKYFQLSDKQLPNTERVCLKPASKA